jgi:hypothetical protein
MWEWRGHRVQRDYSKEDDELTWVVLVKVVRQNQPEMVQSMSKSHSGNTP